MSTTEQHDPRARRIQVLRVCDMATACELPSSIHYEVIQCRSAEQALLLLASCRVEVVFLELSRPALGVEACRRIRAATKDTRLPIVIVGEPTFGLRSSADEYVPAPLQPRAVIEIITDLVLLHAQVDASRAAKTTRIARFSGPDFKP